MSRMLLLFVLMTATVSACTTAPASASADPTQQGATELAAANQMLTQTRAAVTPQTRSTIAPPITANPAIAAFGTAGQGTTGPVVPSVTNTPRTPLPVTGETLTPTVIGTLPPPPSTPAYVGATSGSTSAQCNHPLNASAAGPGVHLTINNDTSQPISFTIGLDTQNSLGQCGYLFWPFIAGKGHLTVSVPQTRKDLGDACYWAYAMVRSASGTQTVSGSQFCLTGGREWLMDVKLGGLTLSP